MTIHVDRDLQAQRDYALGQLEDLKRRGRDLYEALSSDGRAAESLALARSWQEACASAIHQLAGGSKAHWLSREYGAALLVRSADGSAVVETDVATLVGRSVDILEKATRSLSQMDDVAVASSSEVPPRRRFEFVHDVELRPILERAFRASGEALEQGDYEGSLKTSCGILEAIITDAVRLARFEREARSGHAPIAQSVAEMSFSERIAAAEAAGVLRGGCARLPASARAYREEGAITGVSERDARTARQVLHVVMRDLDPGR